MNNLFVIVQIISCSFELQLERFSGEKLSTERQIAKATFVFLAEQKPDAFSGGFSFGGRPCDRNRRKPSSP